MTVTDPRNILLLSVASDCVEGFKPPKTQYQLNAHIKCSYRTLLHQILNSYT